MLALTDLNRRAESAPPPGSQASRAAVWWAMAVRARVLLCAICERPLSLAPDACFGRPMKVKGLDVNLGTNFAVGSVARAARRAADRLLWPRFRLGDPRRA